MTNACSIHGIGSVRTRDTCRQQFKGMHAYVVGYAEQAFGELLLVRPPFVRSRFDLVRLLLLSLPI